MKRFVGLLAALFVVLPLSPAQAADRVVRITSAAHQTFTGCLLYTSDAADE